MVLLFAFCGGGITRGTDLVILKKKVAGLSTQSLERFVLRARKAVRVKGVVDVLVTTSSAMRALNQRFRAKNKPTDVLSFPVSSSADVSHDRRAFAGELAISADIAHSNARRLGHSCALEVKVLVLHGILHLAGFDHERDNGEMARKEANLRRALKLPSSLTERGRPGDSQSARSKPSSQRSANARWRA